MLEACAALIAGHSIRAFRCSKEKPASAGTGRALAIAARLAIVSPQLATRGH